MMACENEPKLTKGQKAEIKIEEKARELRNKGWEELSTNEQIDRMRNIIKQNNQAFSRQLLELSRTTGRFEKHSHKENGDMVVPFNRYSSGGLGEASCDSKGSGKVYF